VFLLKKKANIDVEGVYVGIALKKESKHQCRLATSIRLNSLYTILINRLISIALKCRFIRFIIAKQKRNLSRVGELSSR
ncbi:hypothetical protein V7150_23825, partial [Neobacillus drentensis]|uniref:hypothetical protein n=1 Tax=Neobacillus drentensis TaxID=220684 RepID=UPI002FFE26D0